MRRIDGVENLPVHLAWSVVTAGTFDGVHIGHQRVLGEVIRWARRMSGTAVAVTFEQPPRAVLTPHSPPLVMGLSHRLLLLERLGLDLCVVLSFTRELAQTSALDFVKKVLVDGLGAKGIVMGHGSAVGRDREGDYDFLSRHAREFGFEVRCVPAVVVDGEAVSSTRVRSAVLAGDFRLAERLLGRKFSAFGSVVQGSGRGRELGFATANLDLHHGVTPPDGVYIARAVLEGKSWPAVVSIGRRPTFTHPRDGEEAERVFEVHLLDFDGQIYGRDVEAQFLKRLRPQKEFSAVEDLAAQMRQDVRRARAYFADREDGNPPTPP